MPDLARLLVDVRLDDAVLVNSDVDIQYIDTPCQLVLLKDELDGGVGGVKMDYEFLQLLLCPGPETIYKSSPQVDCNAGHIVTLISLKFLYRNSLLYIAFI